MFDLNAGFKAVGFARVEKFLVEIFRDNLGQLQELTQLCHSCICYPIQEIYPCIHYNLYQFLSSDDLVTIRTG